MKGKDFVIKHSQYHGCWWPNNARSQDVGSYGKVLLEYYGLSPRGQHTSIDIAVMEISDGQRKFAGLIFVGKNYKTQPNVQQNLQLNTNQ